VPSIYVLVARTRKAIHVPAGEEAASPAGELVTS
jgi:hypothetical protein